MKNKIKLFLLFPLFLLLIPFHVFAEGCAVGNCENGNGTYIFSDGSKYEGEWKNGIINGVGKYYNVKSDTLYSGTFINGAPNGNFGLSSLKNSNQGYGYFLMGIPHDKWMLNADEGLLSLVFDNGNITGPNVLKSNIDFTITTFTMKNGQIDGPFSLEFPQVAKLVIDVSDGTPKSGYTIDLDNNTKSPIKDSELNRFKNDILAYITEQSLLDAITLASFPIKKPSTPIAKTTDFGNYHALIIGNNNYQHLNKLRTAKNDARLVRDILQKHYNFSITYLEDATRENIIDSLAKLRKSLTSKDNFLIYYAGHGYLDKEAGLGYWLPVDAKENTSSNWVSNYDISTMLKVIEAKQIMIVADSCYSGSLTRDDRSIQVQKKDLSNKSYLDKMAQKRARVVLSSGGIEPVEDGNGDHSLFNKYFIQALKDNSGIIDSASIYPIIKRMVMMNTDQTPEYGDIRKTGSDGGDFLFIRTN